MSRYLDKARVEIVTVDYFRELGYEYVHGPSIARDGKVTVDQEQVAAVMLEKYEVVCDLLHGFNCKAVLSAAPAQRMAGVAQPN